MDKEKVYSFAVTEGDDGKRLDLFISEVSGNLSRSRVQKLCNDGLVKINGKVCKKKKTPVNAGDLIDIIEPDDSIKVEPEPVELDIVYEDEWIAVVNKPVGMLVHPAGDVTEGTLVNGLLERYENLPEPEGHYRAGIVHRLDKDTSGLLVCALNDEAMNSLSQGFAKGDVTRKYRALVRGHFNPEEGIIDEPIGRCERARYKRRVTYIGAKPAVTAYSLIKRYKNYDYIEADLATGRTHQIRVHMEYKGHPVAGDWLYCGNQGKYNKYIEDSNGNRKPVPGQLLHCRTIGFRHPGTNEYMEFTEEIPKEFAEALDYIEEF